ncbi:MAG: hypothetical protein MI866_14150 [Bacteroidales bacterium]|nr:hypothetical protein [Bacteroidales bacterium]
MSEKMKHFAMAHGIEIPQEIDTNPYIGLTQEEIEGINNQLRQENLLFF